MAGPRVFTSFAIEDANLRTLLVGQARNDRIDFELVDYSVKEPWSSAWKTACRARIKTCRAMIGIVTWNTPKAEGALWEMQCGLEEGLPLLAIHGSQSDAGVRLPGTLSSLAVHPWSHATIANFLRRV
ncbi:hypothetical protein [uncultured Sphingomonas sp.]|uniref:hypothetical protein n=1 Tax=uncultured Sphingomonas sp. TaxID=158754 RepID=UPI0025F8DA7C|nr:hypothetical protein [uncultured Sphingomonas sp.]